MKETPDDSDTTPAIIRDRDIRCGDPVLRGTGFRISQMLAEMSEGPGPKHLADEFDLPEAMVRQALMELANDVR